MRKINSNKFVNIAIDASNISNEGGGLKNLQELLNYLNKENKKLQITIFSSNFTLSKIKDYSFLIKININNFFLKNYLLRYFWQKIFLNKNKLKTFDLLVVLGGIYISNFSPNVVLCQNLLPFSKNEYFKYNILNKFKLYIQSKIFIYSFLKSTLTIYMTESSKKIIKKNGFQLPQNDTVIHHGISKINFNKKFKKNYSRFNFSNPLKILYVSRFEPYKNHKVLADAVSELNSLNYHIKLIFIGSEIDYIKNKIIKKLGIKNNHLKFITFKNNLNELSLTNEYKNADCFFYPSSCESFGIPLIEAMSEGLPIACSKYPVFYEIMGDYADYFEINNKLDIKKIIIKYYGDIDYLYSRSNLLYTNSKQLSWKISSEKYFSTFLKVVDNEKEKITNRRSKFLA